MALLRIEGYFPCEANGMRLLGPPPEAEARKRPSLPKQVLVGRKINAIEIESLVGKLSFSQTCLRGKFSRTQRRPLY